MSVTAKPQVDAALAEWAEFENLDRWNKAHNGNLVRSWEGATVTIFKKRGRYAWSSNLNDEVSYSPSTFETEDEALQSLGAVLDIGR
jgi:hypothetical protein